MDSASNIYVSSECLIELQGNLKQLSANLKDLYDLLSSNISTLAEVWQDEKYTEFDEEFSARKERIVEISENYNKWASSTLPPIIDTVIAAEKVKIGINR